MPYAAAALLVLALHLAFVLFVVFGAFLVLRRPHLRWLHLPAVAWGVYIEVSGRGCPLTTLENLLRLRAGLAGVEGSFVEYYIVSLLYPDGLTRQLQIVLAGLVAAINVALYARLWRNQKLREG